MKNRLTKNSRPLTPVQTGQVWQLADSHVKIGLVGKRLVHYKHYRGLANTAPVFLSGRTALEKFLLDHDAVLLEEPPRAAPTGKRPRPTGRNGFSPAGTKAH